MKSLKKSLALALVLIIVLLTLPFAATAADPDYQLMITDSTGLTLDLWLNACKSVGGLGKTQEELKNAYTKAVNFIPGSAMTTLTKAQADGIVSYMKLSNVSSVSTSCGNNTTWTIRKGTLYIYANGSNATVSGNTSSAQNIIWYPYKSFINTIRIQGNYPVTSIGTNAFGATSATTIYLPKYEMSLSDVNFQSLLNFEVDSNNTSYKSVNGVIYSIDGTKLLRFPRGRTGSFTVPSTVKQIGSSAFLYCNVSNVILPSGLTTISSFAFDHSKITELNLPASVNTLGERFAFSTNSLQKITVNSGNSTFTATDGVLFTKDSATKTLVLFPQGKTLINSTYTIPDGTVKLGKYSMYTLSKLKYLILPESLKEFETCALEYANLTALYVKSDVTTFGSSATYGTTATDIYFKLGSTSYPNINAQFPSASKHYNTSTPPDICIDHTYITVFNDTEHWQICDKCSTYKLNSRKLHTFSGSDAVKCTGCDYTRAATYLLTINYQYTDGTEAAETYKKSIVDGKSYSVESPVIAGYKANQTTVSGSISGSNKTITVVYTAEYITPIVATIVNYKSSITVNFKANVTLHAKSENESAKLAWFYSNGKIASYSDTLKLTSMQKNASVYAAEIDDYGNEVEGTKSKIETIKVKTDFFEKIAAFFRSLFNKKINYVDNKKL